MRRIASLLLPGLLLVACGSKPPERPLARVLTEVIAKAPFADGVDTVSTLEAAASVQLAAQASGRVQQLLVRQGERVQRGQLLLVLDQTQQRAEVASLQAQMQTSQLNFERYAALVRQGAASAIDRDQYRQTYIAAREALVARRADLGFKQLRAPIDGTLADVRVKPGDVIQAGSPIGSLLRNDRLLARIDLPAHLADRLRPGQLVRLFDAAGGELAQGSVLSADPGVSTDSQVLLVKAAFANAKGRLRAGMRLRTKLVFDQAWQASVPFTAVTSLAGQAFVYRVGNLASLERQPGKAPLAELRQLPSSSRFALQTPVRLGPLQGTRYPLLSGLAPGELVITSGVINLRHGQSVRLD
jgi:RND family efflux transporter MFP subunit